MNKICWVSAGLALLLVGCGGGAPYVGTWQCLNDPDLSLEIKRFEEYFVVKVRDGDLRSEREGTFDNEIFSVGTNIVGRPMALDLNDDEITCTNPPNFCHCDGAYKKVESPSPDGIVVATKQEGQAADQTALDQDLIPDDRILLDRDPIVFSLDNGGTVRSYHDARNDLNEKRRFDWYKLKYYYVPQFSLTKLDSGSFAEVRQNDNDVHVFFRIKPRTIDRFELMDNFHQYENPAILTQFVLPLSYEQITVAMPGTSHSNSVVVADSGSDLKSGSIDLSLFVTSEPANDIAAKLQLGNEIATAINNGSVLPSVSIEIIQKLSVQNGTSITIDNGSKETLASQQKVGKIEFDITH